MSAALAPEPIGVRAYRPACVSGNWGADVTNASERPSADHAGVLSAPETRSSVIPDQKSSPPAVNAKSVRLGANANASAPRSGSRTTTVPRSGDANARDCPSGPKRRKPIFGSSRDVDHVGSASRVPSGGNAFGAVPAATSRTASLSPTIIASWLPSGDQARPVTGALGAHSVLRPLPSGFRVTTLPSAAT